MTCSALCKANFGRPADAPFTYQDLLAAIHPEEREATQATVQRALAPDGRGEFEREYRARWPDGTVRWILSKGRAFFDEQGERRATRFIGTALDITARKAAEERRQRRVAV